MRRLDFRQLVMRVAHGSEMRLPLQALGWTAVVNGGPVATMTADVVCGPPGMMVTNFCELSPRITHDGMRVVAERDHRDLTRPDVETIWQAHKERVDPAFRNFAALRFIRVPFDDNIAHMVERRLRAAVNAVGRTHDLSNAQRAQVYEAALIAFVGLPLGMALPSPFGILHELDRIVARAPETSAAVLEVWGIIDDRTYWMGSAPDA